VAALPHCAIGDLTVTRIVESSEPNFDPLAFFPQTSPEDWQPFHSWLRPHALNDRLGYLTLVVQSFLVRTPHHTILIDTCVGDHKPRAGGIIPSTWNNQSGGAFLRELDLAGVRPEDIDFVMCTHLHSDHVGWNTRLTGSRWVPTFPNAKYIMSRKDLEYTQELHRTRPVNSLVDSVLPVVEAGQAILVANDYALDDNVWLESTPGHTPDHVSVRLASSGQHAVVTGDLIHSPVQCMKPEWKPLADTDAELAARTRRSFLEKHCEANTLVCGTHFPSPSLGRFRCCADAFTFATDA
jgi:glyoxylase-like metal-dependent hydrolase (beta-lactamase superfamily II)